MLFETMTIFDTDFAFTQLNGNNELLCRLLTKFIDDYQDAHSQVRSHLEAQAFDSASLLVHTIKGVSGNLGMIALHEHAKTLEPACKSGTADETQINAFAETMTATIKAINLYINTEIAPQTVFPINANNEESLTSLKSVLEKNQFIPPQKLAHYMENVTLSDEMKDDLLLAIQQLNYETALDILRTITE